MFTAYFNIFKIFFLKKKIKKIKKTIIFAIVTYQKFIFPHNAIPIKNTQIVVFLHF